MSSITGLQSTYHSQENPHEHHRHEIPAGTYGLDPVHSSIGFGVKYNGLATFRSSFEKYDASLADGVLTGSRRRLLDHDRRAQLQGPPA